MGQYHAAFGDFGTEAVSVWLAAVGATRLGVLAVFDARVKPIPHENAVRLNSRPSLHPNSAPAKTPEHKPQGAVVQRLRAMVTKCTVPHESGWESIHSVRTVVGRPPKPWRAGRSLGRCGGQWVFVWRSTSLPRPPATARRGVRAARRCKRRGSRDCTRSGRPARRTWGH